MNNKQHLLIVDGMALLFRAFYATSVYGNFMINSKGVPTNAVNGFLKHLLASIKHFNPSHVICCWDMGSKTYRSELFDHYKANRPEAPVEMLPQFDLAKEVVEALNIPNIGLSGYEADDCIGTLAKLYGGEMNVSILTGDRDLLQLLTVDVQVVLMQKGIGQYKVYTHDFFTEETGILPAHLIDVKGLMGDSSDNYPGVKGIGEKTAYKLIAKYKSIEGLLSSLEELTKAQRSKIEQDLEMLHLSRRLAEITCDVPVECPLDEAILNVEHNRAVQMIEELELRGLHTFLSDALAVREAM
ncbi:5'-3' exonuclease [Metabacillus idriensis]|uniref:5'-3' exonuclease n=1 Tax=Metabacillus idriensis TaxID=324768 RepID=A0A6I2MF78_9BACI|nr:5'-3' exonuclease [Metabacillus idriensis]MCM3596866.1 5'-3' exonuclease [Metabacillus idriensis]MRX55782.1 5'-3' exonuclease [Metabacillus idriensis]OHR63437.1 5'-3' exonuclease [Bacillus sp. HMSC76G11]